MMVPFLCYIVLFCISIAIAFIICSKLTWGICKCSKHLVGKVVIVTGANSGIGYETAKDLADRGARVILGCRNKARGTAAQDKIVAQTGNKDVHYRPLDLASLTSVRAFAKNILETEKRLDILVNNAGIYEADNVKTEDGLLWGMQTNHFGHFLLTSLLLPLLKSSTPSRIINVSSLLHWWGTIDFQNLNMEKETNETFSMFKVYCNSKLCNILMANELNRKLKGTGVTANSVHPGAVFTEILSSESKIILRRLIRPFLKPFLKNAWEGAQTTIYLAVSPEVNEVRGRYFVDCRKARTLKITQDTEIARKLWEVSEKLVKIN